jgi:hypothetical protein
MRQIQQQGFTTAGRDGGAWSKKMIEGKVATLSGYTRHNEPLGIFMNQLTEAKRDIDATTDAVSASARRMSDSAEQASLDMINSSRKMREATEKLTVQMQKFHTIFNNAKFDEQAKAAASLADSMERLATLEQRGLLSKVIQALGGQS